MAAIKQGRVWLGALVGGIVWWLWSYTVHSVMLRSAYAEARTAGQLFEQPRYPLFILYWLLTLILVSAVIARLYGHLRQTMGPGPKTAVKLGLLVGFCAGFPLALSIASFSPMSRMIPVWWCLDLWVGACISALISGWLYRD